MNTIGGGFGESEWHAGQRINSRVALHQGTASVIEESIYGEKEDPGDEESHGG